MMVLLRPILFAAALLSLAAASYAGGAKLGSPLPSPHMQDPIRNILSRAQPQIGKEVSPGMTLTAATSQGDTIIFMMRAKDVASVEIGLAKDPKLSLQQRFLKTFGSKYCRKGSATKRFVDAGGDISIAALSRSGKLLAGGKLTRCR